MQVSVKTTAGLERMMSVEVPEERISVEVENRLRNLSRTTRVQGFRPGKVPIKVIQQRFGDRVRREVIGEVLQESFLEAVHRENLRPAGRPHIDPVDVDPGTGLRYTARFEVLPEFELAAVEKLTAQRPVCTITPQDIDSMTETLRRQRRRFGPVQRRSQSGDVIVIDFHGTVDGEGFEGGDGTNVRLELGAGRFIEGFEAGLTGRATGEQCRLELEFPADFRNEKLRGRQVVFDVTVNEVQEPVLPDLDEEFFRQFGVADGGIEAFRNEVQEHMDREASAVIRRRLRDSVLDALHAANRFDLPASLVEAERERLRHEFSANLKAYGIEMGAQDARLDDPKLFEEQARRRVALQIIVGEIIRRNGLRADPARVRAIVEMNAQSYQDPAGVVAWFYGEPGRLAEVEAQVLEDEVVDWVVARALVSDVEVPFDELVNNGQTGAAMAETGRGEA
jgi:trigger factor